MVMVVMVVVVMVMMVVVMMVVVMVVPQADKADLSPEEAALGWLEMQCRYPDKVSRNT